MTTADNDAVTQPPKRRERLFYLDFIRAFSVLMILLTHFNNPYLAKEGYLLTNFPFGIYVGSLGVSVFFVISSVALTLSYKRPLDLKTFYKKRFLSIYPMFWIAWTVATAFFFVLLRGRTMSGGPIKSLPLTIIGMDGLASQFQVPTVYLLGEWFLGFIVLFYLIFPVLLWMIDTRPVLSALIILMINLVTLYLVTKIPHIFPQEVLLPLRLVELSFGIYFAKYVKKLAWYWIFPAMAVLAVSAVFPDWNESAMTMIAGPAFFVVLAVIANWIAIKPIRWFAAIGAKYSYAVFLVHHVIILCAYMVLPIQAYSMLKRWLVFIGIFGVIFVVAVVLYYVTEYVVKLVRSHSSSRAANSIEEDSDRQVFNSSEERFAWLADQPLKRVAPRVAFFSGVKASYADIWAHRRLLGLFTRRELKSRYKDSALGFLWTLVRPLINLLIYYFAIGKVLGAQRAIPDFAVYVFAGLTAWGLFAAIISGATSSVIANAGIVKKVYLPRELFPLTATSSALVDFLSQMAILIAGALIINGIDPYSFMLYVPISMMVVVVWGLASGLILGALNVYMRDIQYLVEVAIMIGFWLTPSVYSFAMIMDWAPPFAADLYLLNPAAIAVMGFQKGTWMAGQNTYWVPQLFDRLAIMLVVGLIVLFIAQRIFSSLQRNFAQEM